ncbi:MAG: DUF1320 domain-containing protein [Alteraurantiacibacter sp.]
MSYATLAQLIERFGERMLVQLTDRGEVATGTVDEALVTGVLAATDATIDGYLATRYKLPLAQMPPQLLDLALAIAIYKLHPSEPDPKIGKDYDGAMKALAQISSGVIRLPAEGVEPASGGSAGVQTIDRDRELTPESMRGLI